MKDLDALLKAVADGLETMAEGIHAIAKKVDDLAKGEAPEKPTKAKPAAKSKAVAPSRKAPKKAKPEGTKARLPPIKSLSSSRGQGTGWTMQTIQNRPVLTRNRYQVLYCG